MESNLHVYAGGMWDLNDTSHHGGKLQRSTRRIEVVHTECVAVLIVFCKNNGALSCVGSDFLSDFLT